MAETKKAAAPKKEAAKKDVAPKATKEQAATKEAVKKKISKVAIPSVEQMLEAGVHFGHQTKRWDPQMEGNIYAAKNNIHIIDVYKTHEALQEAVNFLSDAASRGEVILVGTKRQAAELIENASIEAQAHFVNKRWAGGLLTNLKKVKESFRRLNALEKGFEEGVTNRTKYEVSLMKREWGKLNRLYGGIKNLEQRPTAMVVIDAKFEKGAVREAKAIGIPVIALVDTNTNPSIVNYPIPANDDAIKSIKLMLDTLVAAVIEGNKGKGVKHNLKDYSKVEVTIKKTQNTVEEENEIETGVPKKTKRIIKATKKSGRSSAKSPSKGILEKVQDAKKSS